MKEVMKDGGKEGRNSGKEGTKKEIHIYIYT